MKDYVRGAYEALNWVRSLLKEVKNKPNVYDILSREILEALEDISEGTAIDFRDRLRTAHY